MLSMYNEVAFLVHVINVQWGCVVLHAINVQQDCVVNACFNVVVVYVTFHSFGMEPLTESVYVTCHLWKYRAAKRNNNCPKIIASILHGYWLFEEIKQLFIVWSIIYLWFQYSINSLKTLLYWCFKCKYIKNYNSKCYKDCYTILE